MTWVPSKTFLNNFGDAWSDLMIIPETTDLVVGEDEPAAPIDLSALASASAKAFGYIENNLQYIRDHFIFENTSLLVTNLADLQAAQAILDKIFYIKKEVAVTVSITTPGTYAHALEVKGISGLGGVVILASNVTFQADATSAPVINVEDCSCTVAFSGLSGMKAENTGAGVDKIVQVKNCRLVTFASLEMKNSGSGTATDGLYVENVRYLQSVMTSTTDAITGIERGLNATKHSYVYIPDNGFNFNRLGTECMSISQGSKVSMAVMEGLFSSGSNIQDFTGRAGLTVDQSSSFEPIALASSGVGSETTPYSITITETGANGARLAQAYFDALPNPLNVWFRIKLPVGTVSETIYIEDKHGSGGIILQGDNVITGLGTGQTSIVSVTGTKNALEVGSVFVPVKILSVKFESSDWNATLIERTHKIHIVSCYLKAPNGTGGSPEYGNAFKVSGENTCLLLEDNTVGACNQNGIKADTGAKVYALENLIEGSGTNQPQQYGQYANDCGSILRLPTTPVPGCLLGVVGTDNAFNGGQIWNS